MSVVIVSSCFVLSAGIQVAYDLALASNALASG